MATTSMRSPERARRLFGGGGGDDDDASDAARSNPSSNSSSAYSPPVSNASSSSSSKKSATSSGQKRARCSSDSPLSSSSDTTGNVRRSAAAAARSFNSPGSPRVTKALFADADSSDNSSNDDEDEQLDRFDCSSDDIDNDERMSASPSSTLRGITYGSTVGSAHKRCQPQQSERSHPASEHSALPIRRQKRPLRRRLQPEVAAEEAEDAADDRARVRATPSKQGKQSSRTRASLVADFYSPELRPPTAQRKPRAGPQHPIISPQVKTVEQETPGASTVRSKAISSVPTSPLHSPTTVRLSKHMTANLSMTSPVQVQPRTPQRNAGATPSRQELLGRREVLAQLLLQDAQTELASPFEDLETLSFLGSGVSAEVFKARSSRDGCLYAVKKSKNELRSERERSMLLQEIRILQTLSASAANFAHIVRYFQAWQDNGHLFLQMELCAGGTLREFLARRESEAPCVPEPELWRFVAEIVAGLEVLHRHGVVHLDLKPDNIFVTESGGLKIGDFGMATHVTGAAASKQVELEGDGAYMAKELLASRERLPSADIFCLGITLLEVATGAKLPTSGEQWHALRSGKLLAFPSEYSRELTELIAKMMHVDPASRPSAAWVGALPRVASAFSSAPSDGFLAHVAKQQADRSRDLVKLNRSASFVKTPRKKRLSLL